MLDIHENTSGVSHAGVGPQRASRGFTIIELLVVMAVLTVLIAILLPNFSRARQRAHATVCGANLRTLGIAVELYADEYTGSLPRYYLTSLVGDALGAGRLWWFGFEPNGPGSGTNRPLNTSLSPLGPYTAGLSTYLQCPDFPYADPLFVHKFDHRAASYGYNLNLGPTNPTLSSSRQRYLDRLATVVTFADALHFDFPPGFNEAHYLQYSANAAQPSGYAHFRHALGRGSAGQAQMVFLDGHVDAQPLTGPTYRIISEASTGNLTAANGTHTIYGF